MRIHNLIPIFLECLDRWKSIPTERQFEENFAQKLNPVTGNFFQDFYPELLELNWSSYREQALKLNPKREEERVIKNLNLVQDLFQFELTGDVFIIGAFETMDGFARFDRGLHRVFLGVDESHLKGNYLDILTTHELTHVARESRPEVWTGFGLDPKMKRADFLEHQPVIEHLMGEGFSCAISQILVPDGNPWDYSYQTKASLKFVLKNAHDIGQSIKAELKNQDGDCGRLYGIGPPFAHYVWAHAWVKEVLGTVTDGDPKKLVTLCSKDLIGSALNFNLT